MIKSCLAVVATLLLYSCFTFGQVRVGVHGGLNLSGVTEPENPMIRGMWLMTPNVECGIAIDYPIAEYLLIATQINFVQKGMVAVSHFNDLWGLPPSGYTTFTKSYIEVPILVRWRIGEQPIRWFAECGPAVGLLESIKARVMVEHNFQGWQEESTARSGWGLKNSISLTAGAGGEFNLTGSLVLTASIHYAYSLSELSEYDVEGVKFYGVQFDMGVLFSL